MPRSDLQTVDGKSRKNPNTFHRKNCHGKLPACGWLLIACGFEHKQTKGRRSRTDPTVELIQAHGRRLKAAGRQLAVSVNLSLLGQYLLEQIQRSGIAGLAQ